MVIGLDLYSAYWLGTFTNSYNVFCAVHAVFFLLEGTVIKCRLTFLMCSQTSVPPECRCSYISRTKQEKHHNIHEMRRTGTKLSAVSRRNFPLAFIFTLQKLTCSSSPPVARFSLIVLVAKSWNRKIKLMGPNLGLWQWEIYFRKFTSVSQMHNLSAMISFP